VFSAASNKREIADKQKIAKTNNISVRCHKTYLALSSEKGTGK